MSAAGDYSRRVTFQRRGLDANGDRLGAWESVVTRSAKIIALKGGEGVQTQRVEGAQPVIIIVRRDQLTGAIDNGFRALAARREATVWYVKSAIWNEATNDMEFLAVQNIEGAQG